jgi:hypothetical protein
MSALPPISTKKADIDYVGFVPTTDIGAIGLQRGDVARHDRVNYAGLLLFLPMCRGEFLIGASHYFFNDSLLSSHFHHLRGGFWVVDCPFGGSGA